MADQPQNPNSDRISVMLQDLAAQRAGGQSQPQKPMPQPVAPPPAHPVPVAVPPMPQRPPSVMSGQPPSNLPGAALPVRPTAPPPLPRPAPAPVSTPVPAPVAPRPPPASAPIQKPKESPGYSSELRTMRADVGNLQVGQAPVGMKPPVVAPGMAPKLAPTSPIIVPPPASSSGSGIGRKVIYAIGGFILLGIIFSTVSSFFGGSTPTPTPTPSGTPIPTQAATGKTLSSYFGNPQATARLGTDVSARNDFQGALITAQPALKQAVALSVTQSSNRLAAAQFLTIMMNDFPSGLEQTFGNDWIALAYGQSESFDSAGSKILNTNPATRTIIAIELSDASQASQLMIAWEGTGLASAGEDLFGYDSTKHIIPGFAGGAYRQIPVRYWNFPYADKSIDYAIILAANGKNYLLVTGSREAIFFTIDQLLQ